MDEFEPGPIEGAGGGGKSGGGAIYVPREDPNTLQSNAVARVIDVLGEGPIHGLVDAYSSIFFDETPVVDASTGAQNFKGYRIYTREGTPDQPVVGEFPAVENEVAVGVQVVAATPIVRTINNEDIDRLRLTISVPALYQITEKGDMLAHELDYAIEVRPNNGAWQPLVPGAGTYEAAPAGTSTVTATTAIRVTVDAETRMTTSETVDTFRAGEHRYVTRDREVHDWYVQYRKVGATGWKLLADETVIASNNSATERTFTRSGLESAAYEIQVLRGTLKKLERISGSVIRLSGKNTSPYERDYICTLPAGGAPWDVRVRRISADETTDKKQSDLYWARYTEIQDHRLTYPDSAYVAATIDAEQFAGKIPSRAYEVLGLKIKVPSNYDPVARIYTGTWNGTFKTSWTDNPAWVFHDLCTNSRYGLGKWIDPATVDKWSLYAIAQYCDQFVPDDEGGFEPRYTCNVVIQDRDEAFRVLQLIASIFRGKAFWGSNVVTVAQDRPKDPVILVSPANVIDGEFNYSGTAFKARHTVALVTWNDPDDFYRPAIEVVEDPDAVVRYGWRQTEMVAYGCTSRGQAIRMGKWLLDTEQHETETVTYRASWDHMITDGSGVAPGDIVLIADPAYANVRYGGRIRKVLGGRVYQLDTAVGAGPDHLFSVVLPNGRVAERTFSLDGVSDTITLDEQFPVVPLEGAMWAITAPNVQPRPFQVLAVREIEKNIVEVTALFHDATKYDRIEKDIPGKPGEFSRQTKGAIRPPTGITLRENLYKVNTAVLTRVTLGWIAPKDERVNFYEVRYRAGGGAWVTRQTFDTSLTLESAEAGTYDVLVYARSTGYGRSTALQLSGARVLGKTAPPADVLGLTAHPSFTGCELRWLPVEDLDLVGYEVREGDSWDTGQVIAKNLVSTHIFVTVDDPGNKFYRVRAVDQLGNYSRTVAMVSTKVLPPPVPTSFEVRPQSGDRLYFTWNPSTTETGVWYEIRIGKTWGLARKITLTGGNSASVLFPLSGAQRFWIKAYSRVGLYSAESLFFDTALALQSDRNIVLDYDNANDGGPGLYPGTDVFMAPGSDDTLVLTGTEGGFSNFGEHAFTVNHGQMVLVRNWLEYEAVQFPEDLSWQDWTYRWDAPESAIAWVPTADDGEVQVTPFIMRKTGTVRADTLHNYPLSGHTDSYDGSEEAIEDSGTIYETARYAQGLLVEDTTLVGWDVSIPAVFALAFKVALKGRSLRDSVFVTLSDTSSGLRLVLGYDATAAAFYLESGGQRITAGISHSVGDFLTVGISQSSTMRTLFLVSEVFGTPTEQAAALPPLGAWNRLQLHG